MIMAYGHDDRVCAYAGLAAFLHTEQQEKTVCCLLVDKEEIGSVGATGMKSHFFENAVAELMELTDGYSDLKLRRCLAKSRMLSTDVSAAFDPTYAQAFDKRNSAYLGGGMVMKKLEKIAKIYNNKELIERMINEWHTVANHTLKHKDMSKIKNIDDFEKALYDDEVIKFGFVKYESYRIEEDEVIIKLKKQLWI